MYLRVNLNTFEQLVHLVIAQLLAQARQNISQLSCTDESISILVEDLEASDELVRCSCGLEAIRSVKNVEERVVVDVFGCSVGKVRNFGLGRVLTECPKKVTERFACDGTGAFLVEEGESFFVFCVGLWVRVRDEGDSPVAVGNRCWCQCQLGARVGYVQSGASVIEEVTYHCDCIGLSQGR